MVRRWPVSLLVLSVFAALGLGCFLVGSQAGLRLAVDTAKRLAGPALTIESATGRLWGDWELAGLRWRDSDLQLTIDRIAVGFRPARLLLPEMHLAQLQVKGVRVTIAETGEPPAEPAAPVSAATGLPAKLLAMPAVIGDLRVEDIGFLSEAGEELARIDLFAGSFAGNARSLKVSQLVLAGPWFRFTLHGSLTAGEDWLVDAMGTFALQDYGFHPMHGTLSVLGQLDSPRVHVGLNYPVDIDIQGKVANLLSSPTWQARVEARNADLSTWIRYCPEIFLKTFSGEVTGDVAGYRGTAKALGGYGSLTDLQLDTTLEADWMGIVFPRLQIKGGETLLQGRGGWISWEELFDWEATLQLTRVNPGFIHEYAEMEVSGELYSRGRVRDEGLLVDFNFDELVAAITGNQVVASGHVQLSELGVWTDDLSLREEAVDGELRVVHGELFWDPVFSWQVDLRLADLNPGSLLAGLDGQVSGTIESQGAWPGEELDAWLQVGELQGTLRGQPLQGGGRVAIRGSTLTSDGFHLTSGRNSLNLEGSAGDELAVDLALILPELSALTEVAEGSLKIRGRISGGRERPRLSLQVDGQKLGFEGVELDSLAANSQAELWAGGHLAGELRARGLTVEEVEVHDLRLDLQGTSDQHLLKADLQFPWGSNQFRLAGGYHDGWRGVLSDFGLTGYRHGELEQQDEAAVEVTTTRVGVQSFCLGGEDGGFCLDGSYNLLDQTWQGAGIINDFELDLLRRLDLTELLLSGKVNSRFQLKGQGQVVQEAHAEATAPAILLELGELEEQLRDLKFQTSTISLALANRELTLAAATAMRGGAAAKLDLSVIGFGDLARDWQQLPVRGQLKAEGIDLSPLAVLTASRLETQAQLQGDFSVEGTFARPRLYGRGALHGAPVVLPYQGIALEGVIFSITAHDLDRGLVKLSALSGKGRADAFGYLSYQDAGLTGDLRIRGDNFQLLDLPEYSVRISPDLSLLFSPNGLEINGRLQVPYGLISPEHLPNTVTPSDDLVVINGDEKQVINGFPVKADLEVRLGDEVRIEGYGLKGRLVGGLQVNTAANGFLVGSGELDLVEGSFAIYGRTMDIERGRVLFTGGPVDNPGLDVRAQKRIPNTTASKEGYLVGVDIGGLAQDLKFSLFSEPYMEDTEILSYLVFGKSTTGGDLDSASLLESAAVALGLEGSELFTGQLGSMLKVDDLYLEGSSKKENISLVVGKRITEELYVSYDVNMFSQQGQFRVRYDLDKGFSVETKSSAESTGADLLYIFER